MIILLCVKEDNKGQLRLSLVQLPKLVQSQLCATGGNNMLCWQSEISLLESGQLEGWHKGNPAYALVALYTQRSVDIMTQQAMDYSI